MPRRDLAESTGAIWWTLATPTLSGPKTRPVTRGALVDSRVARAYSHHSLGLSSGSGSARLGLSQKGDLPSSGERRTFLVQGRRRAQILMGKAPAARNQGLPRPWGQGRNS